MHAAPGQGGGGGVQKFRASKGAPLHGAKPASRFRRFKRRRAPLPQPSWSGMRMAAFVVDFALPPAQDTARGCCLCEQEHLECWGCQPLAVHCGMTSLCLFWRMFMWRREQIPVWDHAARHACAFMIA